MIEAYKAQVPPLVDWIDRHFAACIRVPEIDAKEFAGSAALSAIQLV
jgi:hypothetical protein